MKGFVKWVAVALGAAAVSTAHAQITAEQCLTNAEEAITNVLLTESANQRIDCSSTRKGGYAIDVVQICSAPGGDGFTVVAEVDLRPNTLTCDVNADSFDTAPTCAVPAAAGEDVLVSKAEFRAAKRAVAKLCRQLQKEIN